MKINTLLRVAVMLLAATVSLPVFGRVVVVNETPYNVRLMAFYQTVKYPFQVTWALKKNDFQILEGDNGVTKYRYLLWWKNSEGKWNLALDTRTHPDWTNQLWIGPGAPKGNLISSDGDRKVIVRMTSVNNENRFTITNEYVPNWDAAINTLFNNGRNQLQTLGWWNNMYSGADEERNVGGSIDDWSDGLLFGYGVLDSANPDQRYLRRHQ